MNSAAAETWIRRYTAADQGPTLTAAEVTDLVAVARVHPSWVTATYYPAGSVVVSGESRYRALNTGTSGATAPTGTTTANDGAVDWEWLGAVAWDLFAAAAVGWEWIAAKIAHNFDFGMEGSNWDRSQAYAHAMRMAEMFRARARSGSPYGSTPGVGSIAVEPPTHHHRARVTGGILTRADAE